MSRVKEDKNLIVGLDIGTSKIVVIVAELLPEGAVKVIGLGHHISRGLKKGVVVNIESTMQSIQRALEEAELMADCKINNVFTGIAGSHIKSLNSHGMVKIKDAEVSQMDVDRVVETARAIALPADQQILHILTQEFIIDGQEDVREPLGMSGMKLEVKVHIVTGAVAAAQNIVKCIKRCGIEVTDLILQPLASSLAVLTEDEKELGVCLVDIGGGTTDIAVFKQGAIRHTAVVPIAVSYTHLDVYKRQALMRMHLTRVISRYMIWRVLIECLFAYMADLERMVACKVHLKCYMFPVSYTHLDVYKRQDNCLHTNPNTNPLR